MYFRTIVPLVLFALSACVQTKELKTSFNPAEAAFINQKGNSRIDGQIFLRRNDGVVVFGAGSKVTLVPDSTYARERMRHIYGTRNISQGQVNVDSAPIDYVTYTKQTVADAEGKFSFPDLVAGTYYVVGSVIWRVGNSPQGGSLRKLVVLGPDENRMLIVNGE